MNPHLNELLAIMRRLRGPDGCPWDREQTFASVAPYTIEEAYEVADAIERGDMPHLKDELGDLLFQVVFHARMAEEAGHFAFEDVAAAIADKLLRRHPHIFPPAGAAVRIDDQPLTSVRQLGVWEDIKAAERAARAANAAVAGAGIGAAGTSETHAGALDDVPTTLPALMRAFKLSKRAARVGFDFDHAAQTADKVAEELAEVREAAAAREDILRAGDREPNGAAPGHAVPGDVVPPDMAVLDAAVFEEMGDLLFAAANLARKLDVDAEAALRAANLKFERRFRGMERLAAQRGEDFAALDLTAQEALWQAVKRGE